MIKKIIKSTIFFIILTNSLLTNADTNANEVFHISVNASCNANSRSFKFDKYSDTPDFHIIISSTVFDSDANLTVILVDGKENADIIITDNEIEASHHICESKDGQVIKVSSYTASDLDPPNFVIKITTFENNADYRVYYDSKILSFEESISIILIPFYSILKI